MTFLDSEHRKKIEQLESLWSNVQALEGFAKKSGIEDIFQDNGAKVLQQLIYMNMTVLPGREGNDGIDEFGNEWEMKSININTSASGFSTHHHLNKGILEKYKKVPWSFAVYENTRLKDIFVLSPNQMRPMYEKWAKRLESQETLNNPKIPLDFVMSQGTRVYPIDYKNPINPADAAKS